MTADQQIQLKEFLKEKKRIREERARVVKQFKMLGLFIMVTSAIGFYNSF